MNSAGCSREHTEGTREAHASMVSLLYKECFVLGAAAPQGMYGSFVLMLNKLLLAKKENVKTQTQMPSFKVTHSSALSKQKL